MFAAREFTVSGVSEGARGQTTEPTIRELVDHHNFYAVDWSNVDWHGNVFMGHQANIELTIAETMLVCWLT